MVSCVSTAEGLKMLRLKYTVQKKRNLFFKLLVNLSNMEGLIILTRLYYGRINIYAIYSFWFFMLH